MSICNLQLQEEELSDAYLLVFANKQDLPNALSVSEITDKLGLHSIKSRQVRSARFGQQSPMPEFHLQVGFISGKVCIQGQVAQQAGTYL